MDPLFDYKGLNERGRDAAREIADAFNQCLLRIQSVIPATEPGSARSFALCKTHMEQACMHAKKSVSLEPLNQS